MRSKLIWRQSLRADSGKALATASITSSKFASEILSVSSTISTTVTAIAFNNDTSELLVSIGKLIHVYSVRDGSLTQSLSSHLSNVTCLAYSRDGKWFASGSSDKFVIVWSSSKNTTVKFAHSEAIKCLAFNPVTHHLLAATSSDFSFWHPDAKNLNKNQASTINCIAWSSDGHMFALGLKEGYISLRNRTGVEVNRVTPSYLQSPVSSKFISSNMDAPFPTPPASPSILSIAFSPRKSESDTEMLAVADANQILSFYGANGRQIGKEKQIAYYCMSMEFSLDGNLLLLSGSNKSCNLYTRDGIFIDSLGDDCQSSWAMRCTIDSSATKIAMSTQSGDVFVWDVSFATVHALYRGLYAYRNHMTDVVIHNLLTEDMVKKLAIYKDRLAIQLSDKLVIYELTWKESLESNSLPKSISEGRSSNKVDAAAAAAGDSKGATSESNKKTNNTSGESPVSKCDRKSEECTRMHYKVCSRIGKKFECTLMVVGANCVVLCQKKRLQCINFQGKLEREWSVDSQICYVRFTGGPAGKEGLLIGLKNGAILQIFVSNPFPIPMIQVDAAVICLDLSLDRKELAVVDERGFCSVFDVRKKELLYEASSETGANSVAWNSQFDQMLAYIGSHNLCVKSANHLVYQQSLKGFVVGFCGCKVFCLIADTVVTVEVSQTTSMNRFIEGASFDQAYKVACLGVTQEDWNRLGHASLQSLKLNIARKSFARTFNYRQVELINYLEATEEYEKICKSTSDSESRSILLGHYHAYCSLFSQAVKAYKLANRIDLAINMLTDLKLFDQAQSLIRSMSEVSEVAKSLTMKQADWIHNMNEPRTAAEMYLSAGDTSKAIELAGKHGCIDLLVSIASTCDKGDRNNLSLVGDALVKHKQYFQAVDVYKKIGDTKNLARVYVLSMQWQDAFALASQFPSLKQQIYSPYAAWLTDQGRFSEAQAAFHQAGMIKEALSTLQALTYNAIVVNKYADAGYYTWILSQQCLDLAKKAGPSSRKYLSLVSQFTQLEKQADIYYAYDRIHRFVEQPFTAYFADSLFNAARFLYHSLLSGEAEQKEIPPGISLVVVLYALAKQSCNLGAYKLARLVYEKLQSYHVPTRFASTVELGDLTIRGKSFSDAEDLLPLCYRCSTTNPLANVKGNQCINCQQAFNFSFSNFDVLPLVPFELEEGISDEEALQLIHMEADSARDADEIEANGTLLTENTNTVERNERSTDDFLSIDATTHDVWRGDRASDHQSLAVVHSPVRSTSISAVDASSLLEDSFEDPFALKITTLNSDSALYPGKVIVNRNTLSKLSRYEVLHHPDPLNPSRHFFYRNIVPDMFIALCSYCNRFFLDDIETHLLLEGTCAFCRNPMKLNSTLF